MFCVNICHVLSYSRWLWKAQLSRERLTRRPEVSQKRCSRPSAPWRRSAENPGTHWGDPCSLYPSGTFYLTTFIWSLINQCFSSPHTKLSTLQWSMITSWSNRSNIINISIKTASVTQPVHQPSPVNSGQISIVLIDVCLANTSTQSTTWMPEATSQRIYFWNSRSIWCPLCHIGQLLKCQMYAEMFALGHVMSVKQLFVNL